MASPDTEFDDIPIPFPYNMLRDTPDQYRLWQDLVGPEAAEETMKMVARQFMQDNGPRAILVLGEIMENATTSFQEFVLEEDVEAYEAEHGND